MKPLRQLATWFRARSLRTRLAMLTAAAVAVAIALAALACYFLVADRLHQQVRDNLASAPASVFEIPKTPAGQTPKCGATPQEAQDVPTGYPAGPPFRWPMEVLFTQESEFCLPQGSTKGIVFEQNDLTVLGTHAAIFREGKFVDGASALVRVTAFGSPREQAVLLTAVPTGSVEDSLRGLALILLGVAALGVVGAGVTGRIVARSALKPVDDLTDVVEHIARTEEVGSTIPVHGSDEIARLSSSFNSMSTALANSRDRQTRLIADAGHELRTPLTSLRTNVDLLIRSDQTGRALPEATKTKMLGNMKAQMQELTLLIGDLLELSRPDSAKRERPHTVVALHEIADRAVERARLRGPGLHFELDIHPWYVAGDPAALERAVINLLDNAVKYSPPASTIEVRLAHGTLTVRDHGPGIPPEELKYVFDRFWRSPSSRQLPGSGLGLSIVAQTVEDSEGTVTLGPATDGGPGALATVRIPGQADVPQ
ncbi:histidine kinase [Kitasatospora sp. MMS16-BH015]|uniref:sensor histidine kinase n=1 Tax=Kitasatospora sp. MMS16-BH015 TaxID=2018025 RepID=UPI000CA18A9D|nr:HAMP domain-containing sensor histidine kinase [Kitasatospora sp. MMS16-BH015]AUG79063.1 histidine kinase [Kitasatospora sp. MMS16-BH015]